MSGSEPDVDAAALESYLAAELDADVAGTEVLADGLNLIVAIRTGDGEPSYVLRRPNKLRHTDYINDLHREYAVLQRLQGTAIPAPAPVLYCDDESVIGDSFVVTTYLDGVSIPLGTDLPGRFQHPRARRRVADALIDTLADVHAVEVTPFAAVCDRRPPRAQIDRVVDRLDEVTSVTGQEFPTLLSVADRLRRKAPSDPAVTVNHGDFRPSNVRFAGTDRPQVTGVLDWETALLGDPLTELGYLLLRWRDDGDPTPAVDDLADRYDDEAIRWLRNANEAGLAPFTARPGSPSRRELVARYEDVTGRSFEHERFYRAHAAVLLAAVWADLYRHDVEARGESGRAPYVAYMARLADMIASGEFPL